MAALTGARPTQRRLRPEGATEVYAMAASTTIYKGGMVQLDAGAAKPAAPGANRVTVGMALETKTSEASGTTYVQVIDGVFRWEQGSAGANAITASHIGDQCYAEDDQTVERTQALAGANSQKAGIITQVDDDGVWVATGLRYVQ